MKKNIDIPDDVRWELESLALQEKKDLKTFIQDVLISLVRGQNKKPAFINSVCLDSKYAIENICIRYNDDGTCRPCGFCKQTIEENNL